MQASGAPQSLGDVGRNPKEKKALRLGLTQRSKAEPDPRGVGAGQAMGAGLWLVGGRRDVDTEEFRLRSWQSQEQEAQGQVTEAGRAQQR